SVLLGNANGTLQPAISSAAGVNPSSLAVGDFNADGKLDVVTANPSSFDVSVLLGNGNGRFQAPATVQISVNYFVLPVSLAVGDFNSDGKLDMGALYAYGWLHPYYGPGVSTVATVVLGTGTGTFSAPILSTVGSVYGGVYPNNAVVADLNGDL